MKELVLKRIKQREKELEDEGLVELDHIPLFPDEDDLYQYEQSLILKELRWLINENKREI